MFRSTTSRPGRTVAPLKTRPVGQLSSVAFSADGDRLVIASGETGNGRVGHVSSMLETGLERLSIPVGHDTGALGFLSPDGTVTPGGRRIVQLVRLFQQGKRDPGLGRDDESSEQSAFLFAGIRNLLCERRFSPNGRMIASGGYDATVKIWDAANGRELRTLRGHQTASMRSRSAPTAGALHPRATTARRRSGTPETGEELLAAARTPRCDSRGRVQSRRPTARHVRF